MCTTKPKPSPQVTQPTVYTGSTMQCDIPLRGSISTDLMIWDSDRRNTKTSPNQYSANIYCDSENNNVILKGNSDIQDKMQQYYYDRVLLDDDKAQCKNLCKRSEICPSLNSSNCTIKQINGICNWDRTTRTCSAAPDGPCNINTERHCTGPDCEWDPDISMCTTKPKPSPQVTQPTVY